LLSRTDMSWQEMLGVLFMSVAVFVAISLDWVSESFPNIGEKVFISMIVLIIVGVWLLPPSEGEEEL